jgi:4-amino-4-deoxy-L-arabinose transferase-like glycosyltransferase
MGSGEGRDAVGATWTWRRRLVLIGAIALVVRVALIVTTPGFVPYGDPADYERHAVSIAAGHGYPPSLLASRPGSPTAFRPPAYPYLLGATYAVAGDHRSAGRLLGALLGTLTAVLVALLGRAMAGVRAGTIAGGLAAAFPPLVLLSGSLLSESLFLPVEVGLALCLLRLREEPARLRWAIAAGALCGVAALTRNVGIAFLLPAVGVAAATARRWRAIGAAVAAAVVVLAPWTVRNANAFGEFLPLGTQSGFTAIGMWNADSAAPGPLHGISRLPSQVPSIRSRLLPLYFRPGGADEEQLDSALRSWALDYAGGHPGWVLEAAFLDTARLLDLGPGHTSTTALAYREMGAPGSLRRLATISVWLALLVIAAGVLTRGALEARPWWIWTIPVLAIAATVPLVGTVRYRTAADPFIVLLAGLALSALTTLARWPRLR